MASQRPVHGHRNAAGLRVVDQSVWHCAEIHLPSLRFLPGWTDSLQVDFGGRLLGAVREELGRKFNLSFVLKFGLIIWQREPAPQIVSFYVCGESSQAKYELLNSTV